MVNPWHAVSYGAEAPQYVNAFIEIPKGTRAKYELDKETGFLKLDRVLFSSVHYPANYGFIPQTYGDDNDPLDILVLCSEVIEPMCMVEAKVIGVMHMVDNDEVDDKIIAVARNDMSVNYIDEIEQLGPHTMIEVRRFFEDYKQLQKAEVVVEQLQGREEAYKIVDESIQHYREKFNKNQEQSP